MACLCCSHPHHSHIKNQRLKRTFQFLGEKTHTKGTSVPTSLGLILLSNLPKGKHRLLALQKDATGLCDSRTAPQWPSLLGLVISFRPLPSKRGDLFRRRTRDLLIDRLKESTLSRPKCHSSAVAPLQKLFLSSFVPFHLVELKESSSFRRVA